MLLFFCIVLAHNIGVALYFRHKFDNHVKQGVAAESVAYRLVYEGYVKIIVTDGQ